MKRVLFNFDHISVCMSCEKNIRSRNHKVCNECHRKIKSEEL